MAQLVLSPYCREWPWQFEQVRAELQAALAPQHWAIEHIGSTAVPGLCAKPVIDVMLGAPTLDAFDPAVEALAAAGFEWVRKHDKVVPERRYFVRPAAHTPRVHVHGLCTGAALWRNHLAFRTALRADAALRERYAALKTALAHVHANDKSAYTEAKAPFIQQVLAAGAGGGGSGVGAAGAMVLEPQHQVVRRHGAAPGQ